MKRRIELFTRETPEDSDELYLNGHPVLLPGGSSVDLKEIWAGDVGDRLLGFDVKIQFSAIGVNKHDA